MQAYSEIQPPAKELTLTASYKKTNCGLSILNTKSKSNVTGIGIFMHHFYFYN